MENIKELLKTQIESETEALDEMEVGSEQYKIAVDGITKLTDRVIEIDKLEKDFDAKRESRILDERKFEFDKQTKQDEVKAEKKSKWMKIVREIALPAAQICTGLIVVYHSFHFEKYGTITTSAGKLGVSKTISKVF